MVCDLRLSEFCLRSLLFLPTSGCKKVVNPSGRPRLTCLRVPCLRLRRPIVPGLFVGPIPPVSAARKVHFILQAKGGVGKTFVASLLAQFYREKAAPLVCLDTDPVNGSFSAIRTLEARHVSLLADDRIDVEALDELVERNGGCPLRHR